MWLGALLLLLGCSGPKGATPIPEPPSLDPARVGLGLGVLIDSQVTLEGQPGATSADATIRATNLESRADPTEVEVNADGGFSIAVELSVGAEVRLQPIREDARGVPQDFLRAEEGLVQPPRHECVRLTKDLAFAADGRQRLQVENGCGAEAILEFAGARLDLEDFTVATAGPVTVSPGASGSIEIDFQRQDASAREDILFFGVRVEDVERRHPVTLFATER